MLAAALSSVGLPFSPTRVKEEDLPLVDSSTDEFEDADDSDRPDPVPIFESLLGLPPVNNPSVRTFQLSGGNHPLSPFSASEPIVATELNRDIGAADIFVISAISSSFVSKSIPNGDVTLLTLLPPTGKLNELHEVCVETSDLRGLPKDLVGSLVCFKEIPDLLPVSEFLLLTVSRDLLLADPRLEPCEGMSLPKIVLRCVTVFFGLIGS